MKVNTFHATDIKNKYADNGKKPQFKFYKDGEMFDEIPYEPDWDSQQPKVLEKI